MSVRERPKRGQPKRTFRHEALLYAGLDEFIAGTTSFIRDGIRAGESILVVVGAAKIDLLRESLGADSSAVTFADMAEVGSNPARIIPAWRDFVNANAEMPLRGIGEPIGPDRDGNALVECQLHESLLNLAFSDAAAFWLLCPYDTEALDPLVVDEALRSHPFVTRDELPAKSVAYRGLDAFREVLDAPLPDPPGPTHDLAFTDGPLNEVRRFVAAHAHAGGFAGGQVFDFVLAVDEIASNSLRHGGGLGTLHLWQEGESLLCEIRDDGFIERPLAGRERPTLDAVGGRGLWLANQLCDLMQIRSSPGGTVVRLHMRRR